MLLSRYINRGLHALTAAVGRRV